MGGGGRGGCDATRRSRRSPHRPTDEVRCSSGRAAEASAGPSQGRGPTQTAAQVLLSLSLQTSHVRPPAPPPLLSSIPPVSRPTLITSPPPRGSYFLIAWPSCCSIPEIKSPALCYSYYLGLLELACPSKQTLYSAFFLTLPRRDLISARTLRPEHGTCPRAAEVSNGQRCPTSKAER